MLDSLKIHKIRWGRDCTLKTTAGRKLRMLAGKTSRVSVVRVYDCPVEQCDLRFVDSMDTVLKVNYDYFAFCDEGELDQFEVGEADRKAA